MRNGRRPSLWCLATIFALVTSGGCRDVAPARHVLGAVDSTRLLVKLAQGREAEALGNVVDSSVRLWGAGGDIETVPAPRVLDEPELARLGYVVVEPGGVGDAALRSSLESTPLVTSVTYDMRRSLVRPMESPVPPFARFLVAPDPMLSAQWVHAKIGTQVAYDRGARGQGVLIAIVDTGVQCSHPDLRCKDTGKDFTESGTSADENGHGTHIAGTAAAIGWNGIGGSGIAPDASILPVRVLDESGDGWDSWIAAGIVYAADRGARVINLSLGGPDDDKILRDAVAYAAAKGALLSCAAGNDGSNVASYPNVYPGCFGVAATKKDGEVGTSWTNYGVNADVGIGGEAIMSTCLTSRYCQKDGTSMAAPALAGVMALALSGGIKGTDVRSAIIRTGVALSGRLSGLTRPNVAALSGLFAMAPSATSMPTTTSTRTASRPPTSTRTPPPSTVATSSATSRPSPSTRPSRTPTPSFTKSPPGLRTSTPTRTPWARWPHWVAMPELIRKRR